MFKLLVIFLAAFGVKHSKTIEKAAEKYTREVKLKKFPSKKHFLNGTKYR